MIHVNRIEDESTDGVTFLKDLRQTEDDFGLEGSFSFAVQFLNVEMWKTFTDEMTFCVSLSISIIVIIIMIITANLTITLMVGLCVFIVDVFLFGSIYYWGLTLNPVILVHIIVSVGISVDYSAHIAYAFLVEEVPQDAKYETKSQVRAHKAKMALAKMGSSVFHGGFSTFLAILVLLPGETYIMKSFFRMWFSIILFGMANGFILLPVMLSFFGPVNQ